MTGMDSRQELVRLARSLHQRGLTRGTSGNLSLRVDGGMLVTPTNASLGELRTEDLAMVSGAGEHLSGGRPSKEAFLHLAMYKARPQDHAAVHLHSTYATALSCLADLDDEDVLPPLTAYFVMRVGRLVRLPYFAPGDEGLGVTAQKAAASSRALLLANHGPIVSAPSLPQAVDAVEEVEETARLFFLLQGHATRPLQPAQVARLSAPRV
ncbi:class II aldolase [Arthrobacter sp. StoSoilA2]|uniref:3-oxo-tetronate 4-phosphate decarboxylase n=1 Tax=unclassified Arthrobacter TaxID=235627 RepID=UPI001CC532EA|nr:MULTISPECIES: 3-oxo-tetronate 4-phosphate decarboxylase [unclassified Arthrobacter]BCW35355.1 class II aldolase [Arthrobacter sp. StoSoilA2]BCW51340.1 class II aldolase [Arthrobacter sp. StoSoilB13]